MLCTPSFFNEINFSYIDVSVFLLVVPSKYKKLNFAFFLRAHCFLLATDNYWPSQFQLKFIVCFPLHVSDRFGLVKLLLI